jgi:tRNA threonylcarbamoyladenosine biosynthesis protein TsaB
MTDIYILHLETATKVCSVALSKNGKCVQLVEISSDSFVHGEKLTLFIDEVLKQESIEASGLSAVSISSGPGSYTGLRIGVSVAKGLCYALKIPLIAIDSLRSLAEQLVDINKNQNILSMIDARRMEVFSACYSSDKKVLKPISADVLDENSYRELEPFIAIGDSNEKLKELWKDRNGILFEDRIHASAKSQVIYCFNKFIAKEFENVAYFEPFYLKDFALKYSLKNC